jgi:hypothetical protein
MEVSGLFHAPAVLAAGKKPPTLLYRGLCGPQSQFGRCEEEKLSYLCLESNPDSSAVKPIPRRYTD